MNSRGRTTLGALALCALALCAFTAANASALGLTAVECVKTGAGGKYNTAECLTPAVPGDFSTKAVANGTKVDVTGTTFSHVTGSTAAPVAILHDTIAGVAVDVTCGKSSSTGGSITNNVGPPMMITVTGAVVTYTDCHAAPKAQPTKICRYRALHRQRRWAKSRRTH